MGAMTSFSEESILAKWRACFQADHRLEPFWEGSKAFAELKRREALDIVRLQEVAAEPGSPLREHWLASHVIPEVCVLVRKYRSLTNKVVSMNENYRELEKWLRSQEEELNQKTQATWLSQISRRGLRDLKKRIQGMIRILRYEQHELWRSPISTGDFILGNDEHLTVGKRKTKKGKNPLRHTSPQQERELDSYFQIHLAKVFRAYLHPDSGVSLATISRLVVLFLCVSEFADDVGNGAKLHHNGKVITVGGVLQQLRGAGLW